MKIDQSTVIWLLCSLPSITITYVQLEIINNAGFWLSCMNKGLSTLSVPSECTMNNIHTYTHMYIHVHVCTCMWKRNAHVIHVHVL